jgi:hypothetical protein
MTVTYVTIGRASRLRDAGDYVNFAVPDDHLVRRIDAALDLSWLRIDLSPHYSSTVALEAGTFESRDVRFEYIMRSRDQRANNGLFKIASAKRPWRMYPRAGPKLAQLMLYA